MTPDNDCATADDCLDDGQGDDGDGDDDDDDDDDDDNTGCAVTVGTAMAGSSLTSWLF